MKIKLLKDHSAHGKAGDEVDVTDKQANYLIKMKVAKERDDFDDTIVFEKEETEPTKEKKEHTPAKEKKEHKTLPTAKKVRKPKK